MLAVDGRLLPLRRLRQALTAGRRPIGQTVAVAAAPAAPGAAVAAAGVRVWVLCHLCLCSWREQLGLEGVLERRSWSGRRGVSRISSAEPRYVVRDTERSPQR